MTNLLCLKFVNNFSCQEIYKLYSIYNICKHYPLSRASLQTLLSQQCLPANNTLSAGPHYKQYSLSRASANITLSAGPLCKHYPLSRAPLQTLPSQLGLPANISLCAGPPCKHYSVQRLSTNILSAGPPSCQFVESCWSHLTPMAEEALGFYIVLQNI